MAATWYVLYFARETEHIEGRKSACALKLRSHTGHVSHFGLQAFMKAMDILAGDHRQRFLVSAHSVLTCIYIDSAITFCVRGLASGRPR